MSKISGRDCLKNKDEPVLDVKHSELERASEESPYKSKCPKCEEGILLISRDQRTFELQEFDRCVWCGQVIRYLDVDEIRK